MRDDLIQRLHNTDLDRLKQAVEEYSRQKTLAAQAKSSSAAGGADDGWSLGEVDEERWSLGDPNVSSDLEPSWTGEPSAASGISSAHQRPRSRVPAFLAGALFGALLTLGVVWGQSNYQSLIARYFGADVSQPVVEGMRRAPQGPSSVPMQTLAYVYQIPRVGENRRQPTSKRNPDEQVKLATNGTHKVDKTPVKDKKVKKVVKKRKRSKDPKRPASLDDILREYQKSHNRGQTPMTH